METALKLALLILMISAVSAFGRNIKVTQTGASGSNGYTVVEVHDDGGWFTGPSSKLTCIAPGPSACVWSIDPRTLPDMIGPNNSNPEWEDLKDHAMSEIANNVMTGSYNNNVEINGDLWYRTVEWDAIDIDNYTIDVNVQLAP